LIDEYKLLIGTAEERHGGWSLRKRVPQLVAFELHLRSQPAFRFDIG
jgi:hypothetical protein